MAKRYDIVARVTLQKGTCSAHHKVGDEWVINGKTPCASSAIMAQTSNEHFN